MLRRYFIRVMTAACSSCVRSLAPQVRAEGEPKEDKVTGRRYVRQVVHAKLEDNATRDAQRAAEQARVRQANFEHQQRLAHMRPILGPTGMPAQA